MGYYTHYRLRAVDRSVTPAVDLDEVFLRKLKFRDLDTGDDEDCVWAKRQDGRYSLFDGEEVKWYDWKTDMQRVSIANPHVLFVLDGEGEESGDIWRAFFLAGASFIWRPDVEPPEFDESMFERASVKVG